MSFTHACSVADLPVEGAKRCVVEGRALAIVRDADGEIHAVDDICSHAEVSLSEGEVEDCTIECWLHGSTFDLRTGKPTSPPATQPISVFAVQLSGSDLLVDVTTPINH